MAMKKVLPVFLITAFILSGLHALPFADNEISGPPFFSSLSESPSSDSKASFHSLQEVEEESEVRGQSRIRTQAVLVSSELNSSPLCTVTQDRTAALPLYRQYISHGFSLRAPPASELFTI
ncbi:MAG: hypothetical protein PQJ50_00740 [Spirochaetales bacterium]|nr:hypothetical protein [Spirochaetales bacterium]